MSWSECRLIMEGEPLGDGGISLMFCHLSLGYRAFLCKVEKGRGECLMEKFAAMPDPFTRGFFWLTHGLKDFVPLFRVAGAGQNRDLIDFYRCKDRKDRERIFGHAVQWGGESTVFLAKKDCFETVLARLEQLEQERGNLARAGAVSYPNSR